ncbi:MAG: Mur ligase family protein, partial [Pseudomonadota bacterium]
MELLDARRLTGKNLIWDHTGAIADLALGDAEDPETVAATWLPIARDTLDAVGWSDEAATTRRLEGGLSLAISAPIDALYAATEVIEWTCARLAEACGGEPAEAADAAVERLTGEIAAERNPRLLALQMAAAAQCVAFLSDDDEASVGLGTGSSTWPVNELPDSVDWDAVRDIPVGIVTGTNGKTTTVRLIAQMIRAAGLNAGMSSTDWIGVNGDIIERGDWSGPGGARAILRRPEVDIAVLETARGGLLRRG